MPHRLIPSNERSLAAQQLIALADPVQEPTLMPARRAIERFLTFCVEPALLHEPSGVDAYDYLRQTRTFASAVQDALEVVPPPMRPWPAAGPDPSTAPDEALGEAEREIAEILGHIQAGALDKRPALRDEVLAIADSLQACTLALSLAPLIRGGRSRWYELRQLTLAATDQLETSVRPWLGDG